MWFSDANVSVRINFCLFNRTEYEGETHLTTNKMCAFNSNNAVKNNFLL